MNSSQEIEEDKKNALHHSSTVQMQQVKTYVMRSLPKKAAKPKEVVQTEPVENVEPEVNPFFSNQLGKSFSPPPDVFHSLLFDPERDYCDTRDFSSTQRTGNLNKSDDSGNGHYSRTFMVDQYTNGCQTVGAHGGSNPRRSGAPMTNVVPSNTPRSTYRGEGRRIRYSGGTHCDCYGQGRDLVNYRRQCYYSSNHRSADESTSSERASQRTEQTSYDLERIARSKTNDGQWSREWDRHKPTVDESSNDNQSYCENKYIQPITNEYNNVHNYHRTNYSESNNSENNNVQISDENEAQYPYGAWGVVRTRKIKDKSETEVENDSDSPKPQTQKEHPSNEEKLKTQKEEIGNQKGECQEEIGTKKKTPSSKEKKSDIVEHPYGVWGVVRTRKIKDNSETEVENDSDSPKPQTQKEQPSTEEKIKTQKDEPCSQEEIGTQKECPSNDEKIKTQKEVPCSQVKIGSQKEHPSNEEKIENKKEEPCSQEEMGTQKGERSSQEEIGTKKKEPSEENKPDIVEHPYGAWGVVRTRKIKDKSETEVENDSDSAKPQTQKERPSNKEKIKTQKEEPCSQEKIGTQKERPSNEEKVKTQKEEPCSQEEMGTQKGECSSQEEIGNMKKEPTSEEKKPDIVEYPYGAWGVVRTRKIKDKSETEVKNYSDSPMQQTQKDSSSEEKMKTQKDERSIQEEIGTQKDEPSSEEKKPDIESPFTPYLVTKPVVLCSVLNENKILNGIADCPEISPYEDIQLLNGEPLLTANAVEVGEDLHKDKRQESFDINFLSNFLSLKKHSDDKAGSHLEEIASNCCQEGIPSVSSSARATQNISNNLTGETAPIEIYSKDNTTTSVTLTRDNGDYSIANIDTVSHVDNVPATAQSESACVLSISEVDCPSDSVITTASCDDLIDMLGNSSISPSVRPSTLSSCLAYDSHFDKSHTSDRSRSSTELTNHCAPSDCITNNEMPVDDRLQSTVQDSSFSTTFSLLGLSSDECHTSSVSCLTAITSESVAPSTTESLIIPGEDCMLVDVSCSVISSPFVVSSDQNSAAWDTKSCQTPTISDAESHPQFLGDQALANSQDTTCSLFEISTDATSSLVYHPTEITSSADTWSLHDLSDESGCPILQVGRSSSEGGSDGSSFYEPADETFSSLSPSPDPLNSSDASFKTVTEMSFNPCLESLNGVREEERNSGRNVDSLEGESPAPLLPPKHQDCC